MNTQEKICNKIREIGLGLSTNISKSKYIYKNNIIQKVSNDYISNSEDEIVFSYEKVNGQDFIDIQ